MGSCLVNVIISKSNLGGTVPVVLQLCVLWLGCDHGAVCESTLLISSLFSALFGVSRQQIAADRCSSVLTMAEPPNCNSWKN